MSSRSETTVREESRSPGLGYLLRLEVLGEVFLLALAGILFGVMLWDSQDWSPGAARVPRLAATFGIPFWLLRAYSVLKPPSKRGGGSIMDIGFVATGEPREVLIRRWAKFLGMVAALLLGVWLFGFHVWVPVFVYFCLVVFGKMKWYWAIPFPLAFVALLQGLYGYVLHAPWNEALVVTWWRSLTGG